MPTLIALISLIALALVARAWSVGFRSRWWRRRNYFFLRLSKLYFAFVVMAVCTIFARVHLSTGRSGRLLACASSSSPWL